MAHRPPVALKTGQPFPCGKQGSGVCCSVRAMRVPTGGQWCRRWGATVIAVWLVALPLSRASDLSGRYVVASLSPKPGALLAQASYGGTVDIADRRHGYAVTWRLAAESRKLRGIGWLEDDDLLGVSLATGGIAYGLAIYHHAVGEHQWRGHWITSIDSGGTPGEIGFDDEGGDKLPGHHRLHCSRPGAGSFEGSVNITPEGEDYLLTFTTDGALLYRGAGILLDDGRLVVGWSFGSAPAVAVYRLGHDGLLSGRRVSLRGGQHNAMVEDLARTGDDAARLLPAAARIDPALVPSDIDAGLEPDAPEVKNLVYEDLMDRYGSDGWAERWLEGQLTPEEHALLEQAVHRRRGRAGRDKLPPRATIGDLIEHERSRSDD